MVRIDLDDDFIHEYIIKDDVMKVRPRFRHFDQIEPQTKHGYLIVENGIAVNEGCNFKIEEFNTFKGKVEIV